MKTILKLLLIPILFFLFATSCKKEDDLPKATQTGAGVFAAKINGATWEAGACWSCFGGGSGLSINYDNLTFFGISGKNKDKKFTVSIVIENLKNTGTFILGNGKGSNTASNYAAVYTSPNNFYTSNSTTGKITITKLDTNSKIISGTFEFTAEDERDPSNIMKITEGRFDVKYVN